MMVKCCRTWKPVIQWQKTLLEAFGLLTQPGEIRSDHTGCTGSHWLLANPGLGGSGVSLKMVKPRPFRSSRQSYWIVSVSWVEIWDRYRLETEGKVKELSGKSLCRVHAWNARSVGFGFWKQMHVRSIVKKQKWPQGMLIANCQGCLLEKQWDARWGKVWRFIRRTGIFDKENLWSRREFWNV